MNRMGQKIIATIALGTFALVIGLGELRQAQGQEAKELYPKMAPLDQYLMERNAEIAMARSAAPAAISRCRSPRPGKAWLRNRSQRQERFRVCGGARVDGPIRWRIGR